MMHVPGARWKPTFDQVILAGLLLIVVVPLLAIAVALAIKSRLFTSSGPPTDTQLQAFMSFIAGGLATSVTFIGLSFTRAHNKRQEDRLELETAIKTLENLPEGRARIAGSLSAMVMLGRHDIAMRVLEPAWADGKVDAATATWLIDQVLAKVSGDGAAVDEATTILGDHVGELSGTGMTGPLVYFPGRFFREWDNGLPSDVQQSVLRIAGEVMVSRRPGWWSSTPPRWALDIFRTCLAHASDPAVRRSAGVLLNALTEAFPDEMRQRFSPREISAADRLSRAAAVLTRTADPKDDPTYGDFWCLAERIASWMDQANKSRASLV